MDGPSKRVHSVHVRLTDEANAALELLQAADGREKASVLADYCEDALLGRGHALRVAALKFAAHGIVGRARE